MIIKSKKYNLSRLANIINNYQGKNQVRNNKIHQFHYLKKTFYYIVHQSMSNLKLKLLHLKIFEKNNNNNKKK